RRCHAGPSLPAAHNHTYRPPVHARNLAYSTTLVQHTRTGYARSGGGGWIRTNVGVSQQICSLPPLTTRAPLQGTANYGPRPIECQTVGAWLPAVGGTPEASLPGHGQSARRDR